jgi:beta-lactamase class A
VQWLRGAALLGVLFASVGGSTWAATPASTTGQVVDAGGRPVADAEVREVGDLLTPSADVRSDASGFYRVGTIRWPYLGQALTVQAAGFVSARTRGGRLVLHRWAGVSGRVVEEDGTPLAGAVVTVTSRATVVRAVMTNLDGRFDLLVPGLAGGATVTALMEEHDTATQSIELGLDRVARLELTLPRQLATLQIESDPGGQAPQVDGLPASTCPATPCDVTVLSGAHRVSFVTDQFLPWETDVSVTKGGSATVHAQLERKTGTLSVTAPGPGELSVDAQEIRGSTWSGTLPTGPHTVGFRSATTWPAVVQAVVQWNQPTQVGLSPTPVTPGDTGAFAGSLRRYLGTQGPGSFGVYLQNLNTGAAVGVGDTDVLEAASVIKVPEALYLLHQVDGGQVSLSDQVDLQAEDFMSGTGSLFGTAHPGDRYSYQQLLAVLIQQSDNTAWRALQRVLGIPQIDAFAASLGAGDCVQRTDACSARSAGRLLAQLVAGRILSGSSTRLLLNLLETTIYNDRIPYYLGGTVVAHKVGMDPDNGVANDCGVIFQSGGDPVVVCVFTTTGNPDGGAQVIRDIARAAVQLW